MLCRKKRNGPSVKILERTLDLRSVSSEDKMTASDDTISLARLARLGILSTILIHDLQSGLDSVPRESVIDELYVLCIVLVRLPGNFYTVLCIMYNRHPSNIMEHMHAWVGGWHAHAIYGYSF